MPASLTSLIVTASWIIVTLLMTCSVTTTLVTTSFTPTTVSPDVNGSGSDGAVCTTRFLNSDNSSDNVGQSSVMVAAVIELRRPKGGGCGDVSATELQTAAALMWAVRRLNGQGAPPGAPPFIPGLRLDVRVYDDCSHNLLAARHVGQLLSSHPDYTCTPSSPTLAGILGTTTSETTSFVAGLLSGTNIPHYGISATVSELSDRKKFPSFYRTVPSDLSQSKVIVDLVQRLQWTYIVGLYTRDNYGMEGFQEFKRLAGQAGVCVFKEKAIWHTDNNLKNNLETFVRELLIALDNTRFSSLGIVYFGHDTEASILFEMIQERRSKWHNQERVHRLQWLFSDGVGTSLDIASTAFPYKLLSVSPATTPLDDVTDFFFHSLDHPEDLGPYWQSLVSPFLQDVQSCNDRHDPVRNCELRNKIHRYDYLAAALDSFYSLVALIKRAHHKSCGSEGPGVCQNMSRIVENGLLSVVQPTALNYSQVFSEYQLPAQFRQGRVLEPNQFGDFVPANSPLYFINVAEENRWIKIGEYINGTLTIPEASDLSAIPRSECGINCPQCKKSDDIHFAYSPGDVLLLGLYSISATRGSSSFSCGDYRGQSSSVAALLAFLRSIEVLTAPSPTGSKFGALVLDDCYNELTASALLADLFNGKTTLHNPVTGEAIDVSKVVAVIGSQSSSVTLTALSLLTPLHLPTISYSATSPDLDDRVSYPYFLRPVPSDSLQARAMLAIVQRLNVTYVGALHQNNNYGLRGMQQFVSMAQEAGVCVETPVPVDRDTSLTDLHEAVREIRNKDAMVVVLFLLEASVTKLLDALDKQQLNIIFVASEAWGMSTSTLAGQRGLTARGSLVLTVDSSRQAGQIGMADYLKNLKTPSSNSGEEQELPWMRDFWENEKQCNLPGGFTNAYSSSCGADLSLSEPTVQELAGDLKVVHTINAVASVISALNQSCAHRSDPAECMKLLGAEHKTQLIRSIRLQDQHRRTFRPYLDNGNGNVGFTLYNVQKGKDGVYSYVMVGHFDPNQGLEVTEPMVFYDLVGQPLTSPLSSSCLYKVQCDSVCTEGLTSTPRPPTLAPPTVSGEGDDGGLVAAVVVLALLCGLLMGLLVLLVCWARRYGRMPCLGLVAKKDLRRGSQSRARGEVNMGFSPRDSLPLPPVPRGSVGELTQHYNVPADLDCRSSLARSSGTSSSYRDPSPDLYDPGGQYDYSEGEGHQRRPKRHFFHSTAHTRDLRRQIQEMGHSQELQRGRAQSSSSLPSVLKDRPRAGSVPHPQRPQFLHLRSHPHGRGWEEAGSEAGVQAGRPRSYSHDAAFRQRLGALSDDDQQILLRYLTTARQHSHSPHTPVMSPSQTDSASHSQRQSMSPVISPGQINSSPRQHRLISPMVNQPVTSSVVSAGENMSPPGQHFTSALQSNASAQKLSLASQDTDQSSWEKDGAGDSRPKFFLSSAHTRSTNSDQTSEQSSSLPLETPPAFCSRKEGEENPSSLYLHAIPTERDLYLEVLADPTDEGLSCSTSSPSLSTLPSAEVLADPDPYPSHPSPLHTSSSPHLRSPAVSSAESASQPAFTDTAVISNGNARVVSEASQLSPLESKPGASVRASSESSGAVFMSPDQEPPPLRLSIPARVASPNVVNSPYPNVFSSPSHSDQNSTPVRLSPRQSPALSQARTSSSSSLQNRETTAPNISPTQNAVLSPHQLQQLILKHALSPSSTPRPPSTPHSSHSAGSPDWPGIVMRDSTGALFLVPNVVPLSPHSPPLFPTSPLQMSPSGFHSPGPGTDSVSLVGLPSADTPALRYVTPGSVDPLSSGTVSQLQKNRPMDSSVVYTHGELSPESQQCTAEYVPSKLHTPQNLSPKQHTPQNMSPIQLTPENTPSKLHTKARTPRMGVDALSVQRKLTDATDMNHNRHKELNRSAMLTPDAINTPTNTPTDTALLSVCRENTEHPGSPHGLQPPLVGPPGFSEEGRTQNVQTPRHLTSTNKESRPYTEMLHMPGLQPSPGYTDQSGRYIDTLQDSDTLPMSTSKEARPYTDNLQGVSPSPCRPLTIVEQSGGSGGSDHTSGDSGTGEDLTIENAAYEVCV